MSAILLKQPMMPSRWRLYMVRPLLRRFVMVLAALLTAGLGVSVLLRSWTVASESGLAVIIIGWGATLFAPVWNAQVVRPVMTIFGPADEGATRFFYGFFEGFFLMALPFLLLAALVQLWSAEA